MKALVKQEAEPGMDIDEIPEPEPGPTEVLLRVKSVGIDGGLEAVVYDMDSGWEDYASNLPRVFGHEFAGVVETVGGEVTSLEEGDRVAVEPGINCGKCRHCRNGEMNLCENRVVIGKDIDGALAEKVVVPEENAYVIGDDVSDDEGAYVEVLGVGVNALEYSKFKPGDKVAITGPGPVGFSALIACDAGGAESITMIGAEIDTATRLPIAAEMGATRTLNGAEESMNEEVDVFFEASGHVSALEQAIEGTRRGGQIIQIGVFHGQSSIPFDANRLIRSGIDYRPIRSRRDSTWRRAIAIANNTDLSPLIGPTFDLENHEEAFKATRNREGVKITLHP